MSLFIKSVAKTRTRTFFMPKYINVFIFQAVTVWCRTKSLEFKMSRCPIRRVQNTFVLSPEEPVDVQNEKCLSLHLFHIHVSFWTLEICPMFRERLFQDVHSSY